MHEYTYELRFTDGKVPVAKGMSIEIACCLMRALAEEYYADPKVGFVLQREEEDEDV